MLVLIITKTRLMSAGETVITLLIFFRLMATLWATARFVKLDHVDVKMLLSAVRFSVFR